MSLRVPLGLATFTVATVCAAAISDEYSWDRMEAALRNFRTDDAPVKRDIAEDADRIFAPLFDLPPGRDEKDAQDVVDDLRFWIGVERDEWISTRLLEELRSHDDEVLEPLFVDALKSLSPNLRWVGIRWFTTHRNVEFLRYLEAAWPREDRPWVQADLVRALILHRSDRYFDQFLRLARSDDPDLAIAAITALLVLEDDRALPVLLGVVRRGPSDVRIAAIGALEHWLDDPAALGAILDQTRSPDTSIQRAAVRSLAYSASPEATGRLEDLAISGGDPDVRIAAVRGLTRFGGADAVPIMTGILHQPSDDDEKDTSLRSAAIWALMEIDDPSIIDDLADVDVSGRPVLASYLETLRESLGRDRATTGKTFILSTGCSLNVLTQWAPSDPRTRAIAPPPGMETLRCWEYPGGAGDPESFRRLPGGALAVIEDHFELDGESWVEIWANGSQRCWAPLRFIGPSSESRANGEEEREETMLMRREFDLPAGEVESDVAQGLMDAGLLEVIEPGEEVIGVAVTIDPGDFDRVLLLARSCGLNETMLDGELYEIVADLAPLYRGHPALDRFRRTPQVRPGESDEVIDLDLEELSDQ